MKWSYSPIVCHEFSIFVHCRGSERGQFEEGKILTLTILSIEDPGPMIHRTNFQMLFQIIFSYTKLLFFKQKESYLTQ